MRQKPNEVNLGEYVTKFFDAHPNGFRDGKEAAIVIAEQARAEFGRVDTTMLEIETVCAFNRAAAAQEIRRGRDEWLVDFQSAGAR